MAVSAGILLYRWRGERLEVFLIHPGGPFWARKDDGAWTIPKGLVEKNEDHLAAARREFEEETGFSVEGDFHALGSFRQPGGKLVHVFALEGDCDPDKLKSNLFEMEWPPRSGKRKSFPEADRGGWFDLDTARRKILKGQQQMLDVLVGQLEKGTPG